MGAFGSLGEAWAIKFALVIAPYDHEKVSNSKKK